MSESDLLAAEGEENSGEEDKKDGEVEVRRWEAICGHSHRGKVRALDPMVVASEHPVE